MAFNAHRTGELGNFPSSTDSVATALWDASHASDADAELAPPPSLAEQLPADLGPVSAEAGTLGRGALFLQTPAGRRRAGVVLGLLAAALTIAILILWRTEGQRSLATPSAAVASVPRRWSINLWRSVDPDAEVADEPRNPIRPRLTKNVVHVAVGDHETELSIPHMLLFLDANPGVQTVSVTGLTPELSSVQLVDTGLPADYQWRSGTAFLQRRFVAEGVRLMGLAPGGSGSDVRPAGAAAATAVHFRGWGSVEWRECYIDHAHVCYERCTSVVWRDCDAFTTEMTVPLVEALACTAVGLTRVSWDLTRGGFAAHKGPLLRFRTDFPLSRALAAADLQTARLTDCYLPAGLLVQGHGCSVYAERSSLLSFTKQPCIQVRQHGFAAVFNSLLDTEHEVLVDVDRTACLLYTAVQTQTNNLLARVCNRDDRAMASHSWHGALYFSTGNLALAGNPYDSRSAVFTANPDTEKRPYVVGVINDAGTEQPVDEQTL